ncbi:MAG: glycosyltransferase family 4 protein [Bryobacteraceae bacterium]
MMRRLAIVATHPVQYQSHWYRALAAHPGIDLEVLYCHRAGGSDQAAAGFGVEFDWDVPLLDGYQSRFLPNRSSRPSVSTFGGVDSPEVGDAIRRGRYDAVLVSGWHFRAAWQAFRACWSARIPLMVRGDSTLLESRALLRRALKYLPYRLFVPRFHACLAAGSLAARYFRHYGAKPGRVFLVPHTCDPDLFSPSAGEQALRQSSRAQWSLPSDATVFLLPSKLIPVKRPLDFLRALEISRAANPSIAALVAGDGPLRPECERFIADTGIPVRMTGFLNQSRMAAAYAAADAVVLCSQRDTWGLVVTEAMTAGRPCIVSDRVGAAPDLIEHGRTGYVFPAGDVSSLARLLEHVAMFPDRLRRMGPQARTKVDQFSRHRSVSGVVEAMEAVCP